MEKILVVTPSEVDERVKDVLESSENYTYSVAKPDKLSEVPELKGDEISLSLVIVDTSSAKYQDVVEVLPVSIPILFIMEDSGSDLSWKNLEYDVIFKPINKQEFEIRLSNLLKIKILKDEVTNLSMTDDLTGLYNRKYLLNRLEEEMSRSKRYETPITLMLMDIDFFKVVNDMYGYAVGDKVLKKIASILKTHIRKEDIVTRYGDEEFIIALPNTNDRNAYVLAERIRKDIKSFKFFEEEEEPMSVTISIGVSTYPFPHMEPDVNTLVRYAEHALYNAKKQGKNKVVLFSQINFDF
jgi:diguanylate cyclase (GGDEF)-like protein